MKRKFWLIAAVMVLSVSAVGLTAALAGDGSDADEASRSIGIPPPNDYIDDKELLDDLDTGILPVYDGPLDDLPVEEPIEEPLPSGEVPNGQFSGDTPIVGDLSDSSGMVVPGFQGEVTDTVVVSNDR